MDEIKIDVEYLDDGPPELPEDTTAARLAMYSNDECLTRNRSRHRRLRLTDASDFVLGPTAGIADWLIDNWAPIFWETHSPYPKGMIDGMQSKRIGTAQTETSLTPYLDRNGKYLSMSSLDFDEVASADWIHRHQLGHASSNLAIPSIVLTPEDQTVLVTVDRIPFSMQASVEFLGPLGMDRGPSQFVVEKKSLHYTLKGFVDGAIERAESVGGYEYWTEWLQERWVAAQEEEQNVGRRLHWMLGDLGGSRVEELRGENPRLSDGLKQLLLDSKLVGRTSDLRQAEELVGDYALKVDSVIDKGQQPGWQLVAQDIVPRFSQEYAQGYQLARMVRRKLALGNKPIVNLSGTFKRLDVEIEDDIESPLFRVAVCTMRGKRAHIVPSNVDPRMASVPAHRFACATALGRLLWQARDNDQRIICAAQGDYAMWSQTKRANAFAAEFLLPREAVEDLRRDSGDTMASVSDQFGISRSAVEWHSYNVEHDPAEFWA